MKKVLIILSLCVSSCAIYKSTKTLPLNKEFSKIKDLKIVYHIEYYEKNKLIDSDHELYKNPEYQKELIDRIKKYTEIRNVSLVKKINNNSPVFYKITQKIYHTDALGYTKYFGLALISMITYTIIPFSWTYNRYFDVQVYRYGKEIRKYSFKESYKHKVGIFFIGETYDKNPRKMIPQLEEDMFRRIFYTGFSEKGAK